MVPDPNGKGAALALYSRDMAMKRLATCSSEVTSERRRQISACRRKYAEPGIAELPQRQPQRRTSLLVPKKPTYAPGPAPPRAIKSQGHRGKQEKPTIGGCGTGDSPRGRRLLALRRPAPSGRFLAQVMPR